MVDRLLYMYRIIIWKGVQNKQVEDAWFTYNTDGVEVVLCHYCRDHTKQDSTSGKRDSTVMNGDSNRRHDAKLRRRRRQEASMGVTPLTVVDAHAMLWTMKKAQQCTDMVLTRR